MITQSDFFRMSRAILKKKQLNKQLKQQNKQYITTDQLASGDCIWFMGEKYIVVSRDISHTRRVYTNNTKKDITFYRLVLDKHTLITASTTKWQIMSPA